MNASKTTTKKTARAKTETSKVKADTNADASKESKYKISVIIPVYNAEKTLERAFLSVKNQTIGFENIELLLCDDCSTDGSYALIQKWATEYPNVKAFKTEKNSGTAGAPRNVCLDNATAPYIMFLDNDDEYFLDACEKLCLEIRKNDVDFVQGIYVSVDEKGATAKADKGKLYGLNPRIYELDGADPNLYNCCIPYVWDKIFTNSIFEKYRIRFSEGALGEDDVVSTLFSVASKSMKLTDIPILRYSLNNTTVSGRIENGAWWKCSVCKSFEFMISEAERMGITESFDIAYGKTERITGIVRELLKEPVDSGWEILKNWSSVFAYAHSHGFKLSLPETRLVARDAFEGNEDKSFFDMQVLKELCDDRQRELDSIFGSTTWKIASALQKLKFWSK